MWAPLYNWVYVQAQAGIGDDNRGTELAGLIVGSIAASYVAFPFFMFKTNLLITQPGATKGGTSSTSSSISEAIGRGVGLVRAAFAQTLNPSADATNARFWPSLVDFAKRPTRLYRGATPHMWGNLGPDVLCMGIGRLAFAQIVAMGLLSSSYGGAKSATGVADDG